MSSVQDSDIRSRSFWLTVPELCDDEMLLIGLESQGALRILVFSASKLIV
jgi:hypothetical protein